MVANDPETQLKEASRVDLLIVAEMHRGKRNVCIFFGVISLVIILWLDWNRWLLVVPSLLGLAAFLYQMNIMLFTSEFRKRGQGE